MFFFRRNFCKGKTCFCCQIWKTKKLTQHTKSLAKLCLARCWNLWMWVSSSLWLVCFNWLLHINENNNIFMPNKRLWKYLKPNIYVYMKTAGIGWRKLKPMSMYVLSWKENAKQLFGLNVENHFKIPIFCWKKQKNWFCGRLTNETANCIRWQLEAGQWNIYYCEKWQFTFFLHSQQLHLFCCSFRQNCEFEKKTFKVYGHRIAEKTKDIAEKY